MRKHKAKLFDRDGQFLRWVTPQEALERNPEPRWRGNGPTLEAAAKDCHPRFLQGGMTRTEHQPAKAFKS